MNESDLERVYLWRNHASIRAISNNPDRITLDQHRYWFDCSTDTIKLIFEENKEPKGVVLYERGSHYWSFYLNPCCSTRSGFGRISCILALTYLKQLGFKIVKAKITAENNKSLALHWSLGFFWTHKMDGNGTVYYEKEL